MGNPKVPDNGVLISGILFSSELLFEDILEMLKGVWGNVHLTSPVFQFKFTDYYYQEMGENILRVYFSFHRMIKRDELADVKLASNIFETKFADSQGRRKVNIDPGIVLPGNLTLATTKDSAHRIYIGKGIYAEITLIYEKGEYRSLPWTYPDYALKEIRHFFSEVRKQMLRQRKETMITG